MNNLEVIMERDCLNKCAAYYVCSSNIKLYSHKCMQYLKIMDSQGLNGLGEKLKTAQDKDYSKCLKDHKYLKDAKGWRFCAYCGEHFA